ETVDRVVRALLAPHLPRRRRQLAGVEGIAVVPARALVLLPRRSRRAELAVARLRPLPLELARLGRLRAAQRLGPAEGVGALERVLPLERVGALAHRPLRARLCSRRQRSMRPWSPERSTPGTSQPRKTGGRV